MYTLIRLMAISGLHVSILGRGFYWLLRGRGMGFWLAGTLGSIVLLAYGVMVGNSTSTVRAVGMLLLFFFSQGLGRSYDMLNALGVMVLLLLWDNPFLLENTGFWFSVTALLGVGIVGKKFSINKENNAKRKNKVESKIVNKNGFMMSLGITLTSLPVTACSYYEIPLYSPLVNFIVVPLLTPIFCLAVIGGVLGMWFPGVVTILLQPCEWLLLFYEWVCNVVSKLPLASVICGQPSAIVIVIYYVVLFGGSMLLSYLPKLKFASGLYLFCIVLICYPKEKLFEITFLDVGQGDGVFISGGDGTTYFIDGGSSNVNGVGEYRILPFLKSKGVKSIDYWFVSHCDTDHISGLLEVLENGYEIDCLVVAKNCPKDENYELLLSTANEAEVEVTYMDVGHRICSEYMELTCLAPSGEFASSEDRNESSLVLQVEWKDEESSHVFKALFAGDISTETEDMLCEEGLWDDVDLFKAIHHGSNYSNGSFLLEKIQPEYIIVSCGKNNMYGHPGLLAVERMEDTDAKIFYTMDDGQITIQIDKKGLVRIEGFLLQ